jgi:hypothetical protein
VADDPTAPQPNTDFDFELIDRPPPGPPPMACRVRTDGDGASVERIMSGQLFTGRLGASDTTVLRSKMRALRFWTLGDVQRQAMDGTTDQVLLVQGAVSHAFTMLQGCAAGQACPQRDVVQLLESVCNTASRVHGDPPTWSSWNLQKEVGRVMAP